MSRPRTPATKYLIQLVSVLTVAVLLSILIRSTDSDRQMSRLFYSAETGRWTWRDTLLSEAAYNLGTLPGTVVAVAGIVAFIGSFFKQRFLPRRMTGLFLFLAFAIGPGLVVNEALKKHWGRPRPRHIEEFGGERLYLPVFESGIAGKGGSFPSGHAAVAFFPIVMFPWRRREDRRSARRFLAVGLVFGVWVGITRIVQGGHYLSDVLWSATIVYAVALLLCMVIPSDPEPPDPAPRPG